VMTDSLLEHATASSQTLTSRLAEQAFSLKVSWRPQIQVCGRITKHNSADVKSARQTMTKETALVLPYRFLNRTLAFTAW